MTSSFTTDRDTVRNYPISITNKDITTAGVVTLTTSDTHGFSIGASVQVIGVDEYVDGTWVIVGVTDNTFSYKSVAPAYALSEAVSGGSAISPSPAYVRFTNTDQVVESLGSRVSLSAEFWDYNTVRLSWTVDESVEALATTDIKYGRVPRVAISRSSFGAPVSPLDGVQVLNERYTSVVPSPTRVISTDNFQTQPPLNDNYRKPNYGLALYDRNLRSGIWYYYSIFFYLCGVDADEEGLVSTWRKAASSYALTPNNFQHSDKLYELVPPYYQSKDQEFAYGTGSSGTLKRFLSIVGLELDYAKTLADGVEHIYDIDSVSEPLMLLLGDSNLGIEHEHSLGTSRYRSLLAAASQLYDERGSARGIRDLAFAATKYRCKIIDGINLMNLTDDAEFAGGTGSWGDLGSAASTDTTYESFYNSQSWLGLDPPLSTSTFQSVRQQVLSLDTPETDSIVDRRNALEVTPLGAVVLACGLGTGATKNRWKKETLSPFYPRLHGIKCVPGVVYWFSAFSSRAVLGSDPGVTEVGIMWFNDTKTTGEFDLIEDFISKDAFRDDDHEGNMVRYSVSSEAPMSRLGQPYVYAVPYIAFSNNSKRLVAACMFYKELNSSTDFAIDLGTPTLTLGIPTTSSHPENLGSVYKLGDE
jgi:hypothetical protein